LKSDKGRRSRKARRALS